MAGVPSPDAFGEALRRFPRERNKKRVVAKRERRCRSRGEKENAMKVLSLLPVPGLRNPVWPCRKAFPCIFCLQTAATS